MIVYFLVLLTCWTPFQIFASLRPTILNKLNAMSITIFWLPELCSIIVLFPHISVKSSFFFSFTPCDPLLHSGIIAFIRVKWLKNIYPNLIYWYISYKDITTLLSYCDFTPCIFSLNILRRLNYSSLVRVSYLFYIAIQARYWELS